MHETYVNVSGASLKIPGAGLTKEELNTTSLFRDICHGRAVNEKKNIIIEYLKGARRNDNVTKRTKRC